MSGPPGLESPGLGLEPGQRLILGGEEAQRAWGERLAACLPRGGVLFLEGELGSGKTTLVQGLLRGLAFGGQVSSPTYALIHEYPTPHGLVLHLDAYRVRHAAELYEMDLERHIEHARLSVIEWGALLYDDFPDAPLLHLSHLPDQPDARLLERRR